MWLSYQSSITISLATLDYTSLHFASNWKCDFILQLHVNSILITIISVKCLNFANLIVFIQLILRRLIFRNVTWIKCISKNLCYLPVKFIPNWLLNWRINLILSLCSESGMIESISLVVLYLGHQTSHIPRRAKISSILFLVIRHCSLLVKPLKPLIEWEVSPVMMAWGFDHLAHDCLGHCANFDVSHQFQTAIAESFRTPGLHHGSSRSLLQFLNSWYGMILPWGIRFCLMYMSTCITTFLSGFTHSLFLGSIHDQRLRDTNVMEQTSQWMVSITLLSHWVSLGPIRWNHISLGIPVLVPWQGARLKSVCKHLSIQTNVSNQTIICLESSCQYSRSVPDTLLHCKSKGMLCTFQSYIPILCKSLEAQSCPASQCHCWHSSSLAHSLDQ
jgi:hypothetical protein